MNKKFFLTLSLLFFQFGCMPEREKFNSEPFLQKSTEVLAPLKKNLMSTLLEELEHSAFKAVEVCKLEAPAIAKEAMSLAESKGVEIEGRRYQVSLGRSSHKLRNPKNAPKEWMQDYIKAFQGRADFVPEKEAVAFKISKTSVGYLEPIALGPICMTCHGDTIDSELESFISEKYPEDQAIGFSPGEFRGVFWVKFELLK